MVAPLHPFSRRPAKDRAHADAFVQDVIVEHPREPRSRRAELVLAVGWLLVLAKCAAVWWLCKTTPRITFSPWWIVGPTLFFAALCTWLYWRRP